MDDDIRALASARVEVDALRAELVKAKKALAISPLVVKCAQLEKRIEDMEECKYDLTWTIRQKARESFKMTGIERPHPAVVVYRKKVTKTRQALREFGFDTRSFVHINSDLSAYIAKEEEDA